MQLHARPAERDEADAARTRAVAAVAHLLGPCKGGPIVTPVGDDDGDASPPQISSAQKLPLAWERVSGRAPGERERQSEGWVRAWRMAQARTFSRSTRGFMRYSQGAATLPARHTATHRLNVASAEICEFEVPTQHHRKHAGRAGRIQRPQSIAERGAV